MVGDEAEQWRAEQEGDKGDLRQRRDIDCRGAPRPSKPKPSSDTGGAAEKNTSSTPAAIVASSTRATPLGEWRSTKLSAKKRVLACENANSATVKPATKGPESNTVRM